MESIRFQIDDTNQLLNFCKVVLVQKHRSIDHLKKRESIDHWSIEDLKSSAAELLGYMGSSGKNIFSERESRPKIPEKRFIVFCNEFESYPGIEPEIKKRFESWKTKIFSFYRGQTINDEKQIANNSTTDVQQDNISEEEYSNCLNKLLTYYEQRDKRRDPYRSEQEILFALIRHVQIRFDTVGKKEQSRISYDIKRQSERFAKSKWAVYEKEGDKIIRRSLTITNKLFELRLNHRGFYCNAHYGQPHKKVSEKLIFEFDVLHKLISLHPRGVVATRENYEALSFSYADVRYPQLFIGHKLLIDGVAGELKMKIIVMEEVEKTGKIDNYIEVDFYDKSVPEYIRPIVLGVKQIPLDPNPYLHKYVTLSTASFFVNF